METKTQEFVNHFKKANGTGLLVLDDYSLEYNIKQILNQSEFKTTTNLLDITQSNGSYVFYFTKDSLRYIYNIYKQISDGLSMIQSKNPINVSDEIVNIDIKDFRFLLVIVKEDLRFSQNLLDFDFINLAGMIEYINK